MKKMVFSAETVKQASAAIALGFDTVEKYATNNSTETMRVVLKNPHESKELDTNEFPELEPGDCISLAYIENFEACNALCAKGG